MSVWGSALDIGHIWVRKKIDLDDYISRLETEGKEDNLEELKKIQENVNNLISSTGFYFNDNVEIEVEKTREGLKIIRFETRILDNQGDSLKGLDGLAMLLVDVDYNGEVFDMDRTVFAKDIGGNGEVKLAGLTESVAVVAIDKHGNESKPFVTAQVKRSGVQGWIDERQVRF